MASMKNFITSLLLLVTFSSMSLEARNLLQTTTPPNIPNFPKPTFSPLPSIPTTLPPLPSMPTLPQGNVPPLPTIPSLPKLTMPPLPSIPTNPTLPSLNLPPLSSTSLPNLPTISTIISSIPFFSPPPSTSSP
ncbi:protein PELPK1-like [Vicia villosa]|uniref:protein PELPK1-like n=1 Tax=Vicia villosa TaxID=3911 RepID=UPI00273C663E|nr:protein PELPK1-like [Vicia villosa]